MNQRITTDDVQQRLRGLRESLTMSQEDGRALDGLEGASAFERVQAHTLRQTRPRAGARRKLLRQLSAGAATLVAAGAIALAVLLTHGHVHPQPVAQSDGIEQALSGGVPAAMGPTPERAFVWLTGVITQGTGNQSGRVTGMRVDVLDWAGTVRYRFQLPHATPPDVPMAIQAISADGTRALLDDGTVLDQTGAVVGRIPSLKTNGQPGKSTRWMSDDKHVCSAASNEPVGPYVAPPPKGQPNPSPTARPPYTKAGADHSVTLKAFGLDGSVRTIATVGTGPLGVPSGDFGDSTSVLSCSPSSDLAVVARYHDADTTAGHQTTTNMTASLWAVKLSTGQILFHTPETRMALGRAFFFGSENGKLAVQFLWNSKVWGGETDAVLEMPSGRRVPVLEAEPSSDTPGLSSDGTRILRRVIDPASGKTVLKLVDASDGRVIRRVVIPAIVGATAVAQPGSSSFMAQVEGYLALVDGNGGITLLHPDLTVGGASGLGLSWSGVQG